MNRHFFTCKTLVEAKSLYDAFRNAEIPREHIGVVTNNYSEAEQLELPEVKSLYRSDVVHSSERGLLYGFIAGLSVIGLGLIAGVTNSAAQAAIILFAVIICGFFIWEAGLIGIQRQNRRFKRFQKMLDNGEHLIFVDAKPQDEKKIQKIFSEIDPEDKHTVDKGIPALEVELSRFGRA